MKSKDMTINELAVMINKSFDKVATKEQMGDLESKVDGIKFKMDKVEKDVSEIKILVKDDQRKRIERLETRVEYLENVLALPNKE